jgi:hypothetical protein
MGPVKQIAWLVLLVACKQEPAAPAAVPAQAPASPGPAQAGLQLTPQKVEAYLKVLREQKGAGAPLDRARAEAKAVKASGLTDDELMRLDELTTALVTRRMMMQVYGATPQVPDLAKLEGLDAEQKKRIEEASASLKKQQASVTDLSEEKKRFGAANVDLVLAREAELTRAWQEMMHVPVP